TKDQEAWLGRINYYGGRKMWRKAEEKFDQMMDEGVEPTLQVCNSLLEAYRKAGRYQNAVHFLEDLCLGRGSASPASSHSSLGANVVGEPTPPEGAGGGGSESGGGGSEVLLVRPDVTSFNTVLAALANAGKWKVALEISEPMRAYPGVGKVGEGGGRGAGGAGGTGGEGKGQRRAAVAMVAALLEANADSYVHLITACGKGGQPDRARNLFREIQEQGIVPSPGVYAAMMKTLAREGTKEAAMEAMALLEMGIEQIGGEGRGRGRGDGRGRGKGGGGSGEGDPTASDSVPALEVYAGAIEACAGAGDWQEAVTILDKMRAVNIKPDPRCYGTAMRACVAQGNWQLTLALLNTMRKEEVPRMAFNYNIAMQVC
ncbi:unnamed protein product, partial [Discosporangium mesarthrocarpum]